MEMPKFNPNLQTTKGAVGPFEPAQTSFWRVRATHSPNPPILWGFGD